MCSMLIFARLNLFQLVRPLKTILTSSGRTTMRPPLPSPHPPPLLQEVEEEERKDEDGSGIRIWLLSSRFAL